MVRDIPQEIDYKSNFYPLTLTRDPGDLLFGMRPLREKWSWVSEKNIVRLWDLVQHNAEAICVDFSALGIGEPGQKPEHVRILGKHPLYISKTAVLEHCTINTTEGPVYIDDEAFVMDGSMLRGPLYIGKKTVIKMGALLYGGTSIGSHCTIGGEVKNSILLDYSNKAHHGYLGDSIVGAWCNLGAGTSCSNIKHTAGTIKVWDMASRSYLLAKNKVGVFIGDHVKTSINTSLNSGTVIGPYSAVVSAAGFSPKFIPPFTWGSLEKGAYDYDKLTIEINRWMKLKGQFLDEHTIQHIQTLYSQKT